MKSSFLNFAAVPWTERHVIKQCFLWLAEVDAHLTAPERPKKFRTPRHTLIKAHLGVPLLFAPLPGCTGGGQGKEVILPYGSRGLAEKAGAHLEGRG
jgi:hypothetical protein